MGVFVDRLALLALLLLATACAPSRVVNSGDDDDSVDDDDSADDDDSVDDDDATTPAPDVVITEASPEPGESDVFFGGSFWIRFDGVPDARSIEVDRSGTPVPVNLSESSGGTVLNWAPLLPLEPSTVYTVTVSWSPNSAGDLVYDFATSDAGEPLPSPSVLVDRVFSTDLASATFTEPPGVGPILQSQIGGVIVLGEIHSDSDFSPSGQPGLHLVSGPGELQAGDIAPVACAEVGYITAGPDEAVGTSDDTPAIWFNPGFELGPFELSTSVQGVEATMQDVFMTGVYEPGGDRVVGGTLSAQMDTRPLAPELDPEGGEDAVCQLVAETIGVECEECGPPNPGVFCLTLVAENVTSIWQPSLELEVVTCADILGDPGCEDEWDRYDEDGDGVPELCPEF